MTVYELTSKVQSFTLFSAVIRWWQMSKIRLIIVERSVDLNHYVVQLRATGLLTYFGVVDFIGNLLLNNYSTAGDIIVIWS